MAQKLSIQTIEERTHFDRINNKISLLVTLDCGSPACAGGRWDAGRFKVTGRLLDAKGEIAKLDFVFSGRPGEFSATLPNLAKGHYDLIIEALDPETGLAGRKALKIVMQ